MASIYLDPNDSDYSIVNNGTTIFGQTGDEHIIIHAGVTGIVTDQNIERVDFSGDVSDFTFQQQGNQLLVFSGGTLAATVPVQTDDDGSQVVFNDGSVEVKLAAGVMTLGGTTVDSEAGAVVPTDIDPNVTTGGTPASTTIAVGEETSQTLIDADQGNVTFEIATGSYTQSIDNFGAGDVLDFPADNTPTVVNEDYTDGVVQVSYAVDGSVAVIQLVGLTGAQDEALNSIADFATVFGEGTIA